jgi:hypothetical protein
VEVAIIRSLDGEFRSNLGKLRVRESAPGWSSTGRTPQLREARPRRQKKEEKKRDITKF